MKSYRTQASNVTPPVYISGTRILRDWFPPFKELMPASLLAETRVSPWLQEKGERLGSLG
jgi:hypothetical protein